MAGTRRRIAVVGGGVAGLAAAYALARARQTGVPVEELLIEGKKRLGGVILTERLEGFVIEAGPDSFLEQKPEAAALCRELGLGNELIGSNDHARRTYILHHGRLAPLPDGLMLLVPTRIWPMVTTPLLPLRSKLGVAREWFTSPANHREPDESVASFVRRHFGDAMLENIAAPLLAGVYGGDSEKLSVRSVLPRFWEMEKKYGSLTRATLRAMKQRRAASAGAGKSSPPLFMTLRGGLDQLTAKLAGFPDESRVQLDRRVLAIEPSPGGPGGQPDSCSRRYQIHAEGNVNWDADAVVLAMPAKECAQVLDSLDRKLSALLAEVPYSSSMTVSLAYGAGAREQLPLGFGFLVPHHEGRRMLACTFVHTKFDGRVPEGKGLLRCFLGGARDPEVLSLTDEEAVALVRKELREILDFFPEPLFARIHRWPASMAQYVVGHAARLEEIRARLDEHPGLFLAGNAYSGIGISDCIRTGRAAGERALQLILRN